MGRGANHLPKVTIQEVARLAEVSVATVSAVINGNIRVSEQRTQRVREAVAALRYRPDERGRILRTGRSRIIGVVVPDITNPFYPGILREIELARWLMGTHQGAVSHKHLDYYLDEFTFRFNRRRSRSRGKLFYRLAQQAVAVDPIPYDRIVHPISPERTPQVRPNVGVPPCRSKHEPPSARKTLII